MSAEETFAPAAGRRVLFITTKNLDYLRNTQEIEALRRVAASVTVLGYRDRGYPTRLAKLYLRLVFLPVRRYDLVFVGFAPQLVLPLFGWKFRHREIWVDFFISLYETLVDDRKRFKPSGLPARLLLAIDRMAAGNCRRMIVDTRADGACFADAFGADRTKIRVLYLQADTRVYFPRPAPRHDASEFRVLYFGSILPLQGVGIILECAQLMRSESGVTLDMIGPVPAALREQYRSLPNVRFTPWLPQEELAGRVAAADLCLAGHFCRGIEKASRTIPGKAFIYHAMGKPMVLGDNPANREYFSEDGRRCFYVEMGSAPALREVILQARARIGAGETGFGHNPHA